MTRRSLKVSLGFLEILMTEGVRAAVPDNVPTDLRIFGVEIDEKARILNLTVESDEWTASEAGEPFVAYFRAAEVSK